MDGFLSDPDFPKQLPLVRFVDPTLEYGVTLAKVAGRIMLRAAQADLIPARESDFAASVAAYTERTIRSSGLSISIR